MKIIKKISMTALSLGIICGFANAEVPGNYTVVKGFAKTLAVTEKDQLGRFRLVLKESTSPKRHKNRIVLKGVIKGLFNDDFTLNHVLVNKDRTGVLYTSGDSVTNIYAGDAYCSDGVTPFEVQETLIIVAGTGEYANVVPGSTIIVDGTVNNCASTAEYGQNNFEVTGGNITFQ